MKIYTLRSSKGGWRLPSVLWVLNGYAIELDYAELPGVASWGV